jgi:hypothetical protein
MIVRRDWGVKESAGTGVRRIATRAHPAVHDLALDRYSAESGRSIDLVLEYRAAAVDGKRDRGGGDGGGQRFVAAKRYSLHLLINQDFK